MTEPPRDPADAQLRAPRTAVPSGRRDATSADPRVAMALRIHAPWHFLSARHGRALHKTASVWMKSPIPALVPESLRRQCPRGSLPCKRSTSIRISHPANTPPLCLACLLHTILTSTDPPRATHLPPKPHLILDAQFRVTYPNNERRTRLCYVMLCYVCYALLLRPLDARVEPASLLSKMKTILRDAGSTPPPPPPERVTATVLHGDLDSQVPSKGLY
ncbi:hypothetical protein C8F04DRAFT_70824 [Mycena alexandri]|uniref:Uncharacterized protein n=1 Tax=Mycena alexandri TaxID=1745969 RepID=A0AAD6SIA6_9AGAR|nr:hypothetical protein C8F04DRAFT_70824 [Mycena alexandri]